jgi:4'-phosphopantetheinyl transferase
MAEALTIRNEEIASSPFDELTLSRFMAHNDILWPLAPNRCALAANDVHVWAAYLNLRPEALARLAAILSAEEQERAGHFRFDRHHNRFIAARGFLRSLLAIYLECAPDELQFEYSQNGKPALNGSFAGSGLAFNLAHSQDLALIAVTRLGPIGVDVEQIRPVADADDLVERFFSPREIALFKTLPDEQKNAAFFNLWTRKEAWLKATGEGIVHSLNRVEVTFLPGEPAQLLAFPEKPTLKSEWGLRELTPTTGFVGAVALPNVEFSIFNFQFAIAESL